MSPIGIHIYPTSYIQTRTREDRSTKSSMEREHVTAPKEARKTGTSRHATSLRAPRTEMRTRKLLLEFSAGVFWDGTGSALLG